VLDPDLLAPDRLRPLRRAELHCLVELGCFEDERVELLYGMLVTTPPPSPPHGSAVDRLNRLFVLGLGDRALVRVQNPLALTDDSEPEPDLALVPYADYDQAHPERAFLIVEVADTSIRKDRGIKAPLYASAGVPEYWIVNLVDRVVEVQTAIVDGAYTSVMRYGRQDAIVLVEFPDVAIRVADFLS